jgi:hypothetical protein
LLLATSSHGQGDGSETGENGEEYSERVENLKNQTEAVERGENIGPSNNDDLIGAPIEGTTTSNNNNNTIPNNLIDLL